MKKSVLRLLLSSTMMIGGLGALTSCQQDNFKGLTINFWHTCGKTVADGIAKYAKQFAQIIEEQEGVTLRIKLKYKSGYDTIKGDLTKSFATSDNPTIAVAYPDHIADYFAQEATPGEFVVDMTPYANNETYGLGKEEALGDDLAHPNDFVEAFWNESTSYAKEGIYSLPFLKSTESMLYNYEIVEKAMPYWEPQNNTPDKIKDRMKDITWEDLMNFSEAIVANKSKINNKIKWPVYYDSDANLLISDLAQKEIPYSYTEDGKGVIGFNGITDNPTPEQTDAYAAVVDELTQYKEWFDAGLIMTKGVNTKYSSSYFTVQQCVFAIGSTGGAGYSFPSAKWAIESVKVPYNNYNPLYVSQGPTVCLLNNHKLEKAGTNDQAVLYGWKFIKFMTNATVNAKMCVSNSEGYMPVRESAYRTDDFENFMKNKTNAYVKVAEVIVNDIDGKYLTTDVFKGSAALREEMANIFADAMKLSKEPTEAQIKTVLNKGINNAVGKMG